MLEYLDPYHWTWVGIIPSINARWKQSAFVAYDLENEVISSITVINGYLCHIEEDEYCHYRTVRVDDVLQSGVLGIGTAKDTPSGYTIPILTTEGIYHYIKHL